jgi:hypothetical protein
MDDGIDGDDAQFLRRNAREGMETGLIRSKFLKGQSTGQQRSGRPATTVAIALLFSVA